MRILITGGAGFVGSNIAESLLKDNSVHIMDDLSFGFKENIPEGAEFTPVWFQAAGEEWLNGFDMVIHCATSNIIYSQKNPIETFRNNALDTIDLFRKYKGKLIYTSTASVYGNARVIPTPETFEGETSNAYDQSKLIAEKYLELRGNYITLRLSNVYGPNQRPDNPYCGVIGKFIDAVNQGKPMTIYGDGMHTRDYTYIDDVVSAVDMAVNGYLPEGTYNVSGGEEVSIDQLAASIAFLMGSKLEAEYVEPRQIDTINRRHLDTTRLRSYGWSAKTKLKAGLKNTISWMKNSQH